MKVLTTIQQWRSFQASVPSSQKVGLVPTMGNLHEGHLSLIRRSIAKSHMTVLSIFINKTQFNQDEDYDSYPRTWDDDLSLARKEGVDVVFSPSYEQMYPCGYAYQVIENSLSQILEGQSRPGHFVGVLTVVLKLLLLIGPTFAFFGEKDFQQLALVKEMCTAFFIETEIISCETIRDSMGLPLSSRHQRLSSAQLQLAQQFAQCFHQTADVATLREQLSEMGIHIEYIEDYEQRRHAAVFIGGVRLIDSREIAMLSRLPH